MRRPSWMERLGWGALIGLAGGLIGLGGAEFRLPVLVGLLGYATRLAIPINLTISFATLLAALVARSQSLSLTPLVGVMPVIGGFIAGALVTAFYGTTLLRRLPDHRLERITLIILFGVGIILIAEGVLALPIGGLPPTEVIVQVLVAVVFGLGIGLVSSLLGVAGGELIIPSLILVFAVDPKTAGTASALISLPTIAIGLLRHQRQGTFPGRAPIAETVAPMSIGSLIGAAVGGLVVGMIPADLLKMALGLILIVSGLKVFGKGHKAAKVTS